MIRVSRNILYYVLIMVLFSNVGCLCWWGI